MHFKRRQLRSLREDLRMVRSTDQFSA